MGQELHCGRRVTNPLEPHENILFYCEVSHKNPKTAAHQSKVTDPTISPSKDDRDTLYHLTRSLRALMNNTHGLQSTLTHPDGIPTLTLLLYTWPTLSIWKNKTIVLDLLSAVCFVPPDGHLVILEALQGWRDLKRVGRRMEVLCGGLRQREGVEEVEGEPSFYMEYQVGFLLLWIS